MMMKYTKNYQNYKWLPKILPDDEILKQRAYGCFLKDFKPRNIWLNGKLVIINKNDTLTFNHLITEGQETNRVHSTSRCQRIPWIKALIENANTDKVKYWIEIENGTKVHYLALPDFSYLVILKSNNSETIGLSTAYCVDYDGRDTLNERFYLYKTSKKSGLVKKKVDHKNISKFDTCFHLKMQGYSEQEISDITNIPLNEVSRLLKRLF